MGNSIEIKEYDGARSVTVKRVPGLIILETGDHCFAFDTSIALNAMKKLFNVAVIVEWDDATPLGDPIAL